MIGAASQVATIGLGLSLLRPRLVTRQDASGLAFNIGQERSRLRLNLADERLVPYVPFRGGASGASPGCRYRQGRELPVFLVAFVALALMSVPLTGGQLGALARVRFRGVALLAAALAVQVLIISFVPGGPSWLHPGLHLATYVAALAFLAANFVVPGIRTVALGGFLNFVAIAANGGVMPASRGALVDAGRGHTDNAFDNSAVVGHARLRFLGDVFAMPGWMPLHNVFSVGDVLIGLGVAVALHVICDTRLARAMRVMLPHRRREVVHAG